MTDDSTQIRYWEEDHRFRDIRHFVVALFARQRLDFLANWVSFPEVKSALDVGCGSGISTIYLAERVPTVFGVERSSGMLARHPMRDIGRLVQGDSYSLPFRDNSVDLVIAWEVLHHMTNPGIAIAEMVRVSRRYVILAEPNRYHPAQFLFSLLDPEHRLVLRYSLSFLRQLAEAADIEIVAAVCGGWIFPNRTPAFLAPLLGRLPYRTALGISNLVIGVKK